MDARVVRIRPEHPTDTLQRLPYLVGVCEPTAPTSGLSLSLVIVPPGAVLESPAGVPHQAVNLSQTERAVAVVARNDAGERERVVLVDPAP